ncbi:MAG: 23S rRNA (uracil(1939)-C(5))-methyltransferase RlmD [Burkholderiaceae bacterium]
MSRRRADRADARGRAELIRLQTESLDLQANAIARHEGKVVFVRGALPGETVLARRVRTKPRFDVAELETLLRESALRVRPRCPHFGVCGGCSMQHLSSSAQLAIKQRALEDQLQHVGGVRPEQILRPLAGPDWGYRYRARLSVRHVPKKGGVLVGFHERGSSYVADMRECHVLPPALSGLLLPLRELIAGLSIRDRLPQIEVAVGERPGVSGEPVIALVFRVLEPPSESDRARLREFGAANDLQLWLQPKGPDSIVALDPDDVGLVYRLPEFNLAMPFLPTDFTQVNHQINRVLVNRAISLLAPQAGERIADLFCGLGNFSLPIARRGARVLGLEASETLCARAREAAAGHGLQGQAEFAACDLFKVDTPAWQAFGRFDKLLIDPPREGALAVVKALAQADYRPRRIVYVSCNPATLARDASILVHFAGYRLVQAGALNMFPHTSHVESMARFETGG